MDKKGTEPGPLLTIVGGQPRQHRTTQTMQIPVNVEKLLLLAAQDEKFKKKLISNRQAALTESGVTLRPSEAAMLTAIKESSLKTMVAGIVPKNPKRRRFMSLVAATAASLAAGTAEIGCDPKDDHQPMGADADADVDADADGDGDGDGDADADAGEDGGEDSGSDTDN